MLFLIISEPAPARPSEVRGDRRAFWDWLEPARRDGSVHWCYPRAGRGAVALVDLASHETLHRFLTQWAEIIPARFDVLPLVDETAARSLIEES